MAKELVERKLGDDKPIIKDAENSNQLEQLLEEANQYATNPVHKSSTAFYIKGKMGIEGVRVELEYDIEPDLNGPFPVEDPSRAQLDISQYRANAGEVETTGYLREDDTLLIEFQTNDETMPQVSTTTYDGNTYIQIDE